MQIYSVNDLSNLVIIFEFFCYYLMRNYKIVIVGESMYDWFLIYQILVLLKNMFLYL